MTGRDDPEKNSLAFRYAEPCPSLAEVKVLRAVKVGDVTCRAGSVIRFGGILGRFSRAPTYPIRALGVAATRGRPVNVARVTVWDVVDDVPFLATRVHRSNTVYSLHPIPSS